MARETLQSIRANKLPDAAVNFRVSDFLSEDEQHELRAANLKGKKKNRAFDEVDAFEAELLARFGWQAYQAWLCGEFEMATAARFIAAERAREVGQRIPLMALINSAVMGANHADSNGHAPKSLRHAQKILKEQIQQTKGA